MKLADDCALLAVYLMNLTTWIVLIGILLQTQQKRQRNSLKDLSFCTDTRQSIFFPSKTVRFPFKVWLNCFVFFTLNTPLALDIVLRQSGNHSHIPLETVVKVSLLLRIFSDAVLPFLTDRKLCQIGSDKTRRRSLAAKQAVAQFRGEFLAIEAGSEREKRARQSRSNSYIASMNLSRASLIDTKSSSQFLSVYQSDKHLIRRPTM